MRGTGLPYLEKRLMNGVNLRATSGLAWLHCCRSPAQLPAPHHTNYSVLTMCTAQSFPATLSKPRVGSVCTFLFYFIAPPTSYLVILPCYCLHQVNDGISVGEVRLS